MNQTSSLTDSEFCPMTGSASPGSEGEVFQITYHQVLLTGEDGGWSWNILHAKQEPRHFDVMQLYV